MPDEASMSRTAVKTYVPCYQKDAWETHADELGMSQSEFVRTMVQAGRRHFPTDEVEQTTQTAQPDPDGSTDEDSDDLTDTVCQHLSRADALTWDELLAAVTDDVEARLEDALDELQAENTVKYSGRDGGYILVDA